VSYLDYLKGKRERDLALVRGLHGSIAGDDEPRQTAAPGFDGGVRIDPTPHSSSPEGVFGPFPSEEPEPGWSVEYEIPDGAELVFPSLREEG
jgi:hypothetical protein